MLHIDLYTEITCPWCIIGHYRLDKVLAERFPDLAVNIRQHPVLLLPDAPAEGLYIPDLLRSRYGVTDPKAAFARPEAEARASGLDLDLSRQPWAYRTQAAHGLILAAQASGTGHALAVAISDAYFLEAKNISDADVLADIAAGHGFEREAARALALDPAQHRRVEEEAAQSAAAGVRSVPHFVFGGRIAIHGGRGEDEIATAVRQAASIPASA
ncbi:MULTISPECIES: DsbA family oxidoreductase [unclassified Novosphingobium]|uniref:DsbA family oxidoreductase n=1 Tax=unclassified Novosphingobium TaxID=2644732 RepID=UPI001494629C|nr:MULTISPECIES: DsbA family protein [unclassified Novosphingobium]MBB3356346.1 putative DsbA family dithiol-disulfide isomerase [Novosphingobium sp. BK256]MBB3372747.1 putative DsbA family dithiol-disulfide isomerase [Novosphingobium sp. BK280]MBB3377115.1 putative DsbA family dithiol-disulfide isomerase [Novosphingobium sp. BK258]MBB3419474.1 putative DsbA family dithiol-disulfide isomerase [Novosphingobium sp. BK267]MBB3448709.1 putative DsbA family dithiol-disulfide isomerase [Novosphingob